MTLNLKLFRTPIAAIGAGMLLLAASVVGLTFADAQVGRAIQARYDSYLLADELRQSSDDLTRLARTYVATGDAKWEQQYFEVLDIRNGKRPRPAHYERIYWDFRAADATPAGGDGESLSLTDRMRRAGFEPVPSYNPYWDIMGATFEDADGYRVVFQRAPWQDAA